MKRELIHDKQPFGEVHDSIMHPSGLNGYGMTRKSLGSDMEVGVNARNHAPATVDNSAGAMQRGMAHTDSMLTHWTGKPKSEV